MFLVGYFDFLSLSNLVPHAIGELDPSCHFAGGDLLFGKREASLVLKWSTTIQTRDQVKVITLTRLDMLISPYGALTGIFRCYNPVSMESLFQVQVNRKFQVFTDSRVRKTLSTLNQAMGNSQVILHISLFLTFRCHTGLQKSSAHRQHSAAWHLDVP